MTKINLDKYYTPVSLAEYCINKTYEIIGKENITEIIEPSAGNGSFSLQIPDCIAYDIEPEHESIIKQDYLKLELEYKKGRLIIGNPPFGKHNTLSVSFYKKSCKISDFIVFILPISQLDNPNEMFDYDLIYSENLGNNKYSNIEVPCCLNIYTKPINGNNKKPINKLEDVSIDIHLRGRKTQEIFYDSDLRICAFGASAGKVVKYNNQYCKEILFIVNNSLLKERIVEVVNNANWIKRFQMTKTPCITRWQIVKYLKEQIPEIK